MDTSVCARRGVIGASERIEKKEKKKKKKKKLKLETKNGMNVLVYKFL